MAQTYDQTLPGQDCQSALYDANYETNDSKKDTLSFTSCVSKTRPCTLT